MARFITRSTRSVDTQGPTAPVITAFAASTSTVTVTRTSNATDPSGILNYETQRSLAGAGAWTTVDTSNTSPLTVSGLSAGTAYDFRQRANDTVGNAGTFSAIASATTASSGSALFTDDFSSGNFSKTQNGFTWNPNNVAVISGFSRLGNVGNCARFDFVTSNWPELRFDFGTNYPEVFFRWYQYFPDGTESPTRGPRVARTNLGFNNNKLLRCWGGTSYDNADRPRYGSETFTSGSPGDEVAGLEAALTEGLDDIGTIPGSSDFPILTNALRGRWFKIEFRLKMNTSHSTPNGAITCWIDDVLQSTVTNLNSAFGPGTGFRAGYLWGNQNQRYDAFTYVYVSDFAFGVSGRV